MFTYIYTHTIIRIQMFIVTHIYIMCIYLCIYIFTHIHTHTIVRSLMQYTQKNGMYT